MRINMNKIRIKHQSSPKSAKILCDTAIVLCGTASVIYIYIYIKYNIFLNINLFIPSYNHTIARHDSCCYSLFGYLFTSLIELLYLLVNKTLTNPSLKCVYIEEINCS